MNPRDPNGNGKLRKRWKKKLVRDRGPGHPTKLDAEKRERFIGYIKAGADPIVARSMVGISKQNWHLWRKRAEEGREPWATLMVDVEDAMNHAEIMQTMRLVKAGEFDWRAVLAWLKCARPERWNQPDVAPPPAEATDAHEELRERLAQLIDRASGKDTPEQAD